MSAGPTIRSTEESEDVDMSAERILAGLDSARGGDSSQGVGRASFPPGSSWRPSIAALAPKLGWLLLFLALAVALQDYSGALGSELGGYPDEAAHYVTGLMVRDYLAGHRWAGPVGFAENYYLHYPKVALGHWPPVLYALEAAWTLVLPSTQSSVLLLMACLTALLGLTVFLLVRREWGNLAAVPAGLLCIALPIVQESTGRVMAEIPVTLLSLWAALAFGLFLENEEWRWSALFGVLASLAILTKGNGFSLVVVPPLGVLLTRKWHLARRPAFWYPALIVVLLCGPWYWATKGMLQSTWEHPEPSLSYSVMALRYYSFELVKVMGWVLSAVAVLGLADKLAAFRHRPGVQGRWAALLAMLLGFFVMACVLPATTENRFLVPTAPALVVFLFAGLRRLSHLPGFRSFRPAYVTGGLLAVTILAFASETFYVPRKADRGFGGVAQALLSQPDLRNAVFLVASDATGEGMFIADVAEAEKRPGHIVLRASKMLSSVTWIGKDYRALYKTPQETQQYLDSIPIDVVVLDDSLPLQQRPEHQRVLEEAIAQYSSRWRRVGTFPLVRRGIRFPQALHVYRLTQEKTGEKGIIRINLTMLGKTIKLKRNAGE